MNAARREAPDRNLALELVGMPRSQVTLALVALLVLVVIMWLFTR